MNICHHIIQDNLIAGIGPLMEEQYPDLNTRMLYNSRQLSFLLHLKRHSAKIESEWFNLGNGETDAEKASRKNYAAWRRMYHTAFAEIVQMLEQKSLPHRENNY